MIATHERLQIPGLLALLLSVILVAGCSVEATETSAKKAASGEQIFLGTYDWAQGGTDELAVSFKPKGEDRWKVKCRFTFDGRNSIWKGTAEGSLVDGSKVTGDVRGGGSRTWRFNGVIDGDVLTADHFELRDGELLETGTFKVRR